MIHRTKKSGGFIAIMTVIILSAVLLALVSVSNTAGYFARFNGTNREFNRQAFALAESCANSALLSLARDYSYAPTTPVQITLGSDSCTIDSLVNTGEPSSSSRTVTITASANYHNTFSTVEVVVIITNPSGAPPGQAALPAVTITSWQELR